MAKKKAAGSKSSAKAGSPFDALALDDVKKLVADSLPKEFAVSALFMAGEHWQEGKGWVGPVPDLDDPDYGTTLDLIKTAFTSRNVIKEVTLRHMRGVVGGEPVFGIAPRLPLMPGDKLEDGKVEERRGIEADLTDWWNARNAHLSIQSAVGNSLVSTRGILRLYVPAGKVINGVVPTQPTLASALSLIFLDAPSPEHAAVIVDDATKDQLGILLTETGGEEAVEMSYLGASTSTVENDPTNPRPTIIKLLGAEPNEYEIQAGGRVLMYAIERSLFITQQQQEMQRALNLALSMIPRTVVTGGFLERIILNALPPGHWETDSRGRKTNFVRETWQTGPGTTQWIRGIELPQQDGTVDITTPSVTMREPVDTAPADSAVRSIYRDMLEEGDQAHVLMSSEATPSGNSRREGRSDFQMSLTETEAPANGAGRWLIETLLALAETFMGQPGSILTDWRGQFECQVNAGPVSVEERVQTLAEFAAGLLSQETAMARIGVLDTQAETDRILAENGGVDLALLDRRADIMVKLTSAGASIDGAAELVGIDATDAKKLIAPDMGGTDPNGPLDPTADPSADPTAPPSGGGTPPKSGGAPSSAN